MLYYNVESIYIHITTNKSNKNYKQSKAIQIYELHIILN